MLIIIIVPRLLLLGLDPVGAAVASEPRDPSCKCQLSAFRSEDYYGSDLEGDCLKFICLGHNPFLYLPEKSASSFRMALSVSLRTVFPTSSSNSFCDLSKALMTRRAHFFPSGFKVSW